MKNLSPSTKAVSAKTINRQWHLVDLDNQVLGRAMGEIIKLLTGKHKANYVDYLDMGDNVVVVNAGNIRITGKKDQQKEYTYFSGYPSGLRKVNFANLKARRPEEIIRHAVAGMLPKNKLRDRRLARLHVFAGAQHKFQNELKSGK